jgi:hypothetical protein
VVACSTLAVTARFDAAVHSYGRGSVRRLSLLNLRKCAYSALLSDLHDLVLLGRLQMLSHSSTAVMLPTACSWPELQILQHGTFQQGPPRLLLCSCPAGRWAASCSALLPSQRIICNTSENWVCAPIIVLGCTMCNVVALRSLVCWQA